MSAGLRTATYEKKKANRNGVLRMGFTVLSIFLEVVLIISLFTSLNRYAEWINVGTRVLSTLMVLVIYGQHKTSAMKMPWIILILVFPVVGLTLYFLIGLNYSTHKMRKRYEDIDSVLLPLLSENREVEKELHRETPDKAAASDYLWRNA
ncbi:MAG TPA: cardiolipin synthase, partial [Lachnospiraceae bacterium]|nr:cardiolipin synthase [Lachnospiraceae bacterium]